MCNLNLMVDVVHIYNSVKKQQQQQKQNEKAITTIITETTRKVIITSGFLMCLHFEIFFYYSVNT